MNAIMMLHRAMAGYLAAQGGGGGSKYIEFADPEVFRVLMENGVSSDGIGITVADAEAVTDIGTWFKGNTEITSFDEFEKFEGVTSIGDSINNMNKSAFYQCTGLERISLPSSLTFIGNYVFSGCSSLTSVKGLDHVVTFGNGVFNKCSSLSGNLILPRCEKMTQFQNAAISHVLDLGKITTLDGITSSYANAFFDNCVNLELIITPTTLTSVKARAIGRCSSLKFIVFKATTPPEIDGYLMGIANSTPTFYVPDESVADYQAATNWVSLASRIKGISSLQTDNQTLHNEIKDYL